MRKLTFLALGAVPLALLACSTPRSEDLARVSSSLDDRSPSETLDRSGGPSAGDHAAPPRDCPPPSPDLCDRPDYVRGACGFTCKELLRPKLDEYLKRLPYRRKMWPNHVPKDSFNLVLAPFDPYQGKNLLPALGQSVAAQEEKAANDFRSSAFAETPQAIALAVSKAATYHQNPDWDLNGEVIGSCEEYVYESFYDYSRFRDAVLACNGNKSCIFDIAYLPGNPGIANRALNRKDGLPIWKQPGEELGDIVAFGKDAPKNAYYRLGGNVMKGIPALFPDHPHVAALGPELDSGRHYWNSGATGDRVKHASDFDYLAFVQKKTIGLGIEEFEEYERRTAEIDALTGAYEQRLAALGACPAYQGYQGSNPLAPSSPSNQVTGLGVVNPGVSTGQLAGLLNLAPQLLAASCGTSYEIPLVETLAPQMAYPYGEPEPGLACPPDKANDSLAILARNAGCRLANALLVEWNRRQRGGGGCLDSGFYGCDYSPTRFVDRYATKDLYATDREKLLADCVERTAGQKVDPPQPDLITMSGYIKSAASQISEEKRTAKMIEPGRFGQILSEGEQWGEPKVFSASYEAYLGWGVETLRSNREGLPCRMGAFARAQLTARAETIVDPLIDAASLYSDPTGIPWGQRWNNLVNAEGWVTVGELRGEFDDNSASGGYLSTTVQEPATHHGAPWPTKSDWQTGDIDKLARGLFHLVVAGEELFDEYGEIELNQTYKKSLIAFQEKTPKMSVDFWVGPVPVTLGAWGVLSYGAYFKAESAVPITCNLSTEPPAPFKMTASIVASAKAEAGAQAGIGISGIASGGVRGYLTLLEAELPLQANAAFVAKDPGAFALDLGLGSELKVRTLDGRLALYAEALGIDVFEYELFRWNGFRHTLPIFDVSASVPLTSINQ